MSATYGFSPSGTAELQCNGVVLPDEPSLHPDHPIRLLEGISYPFFLMLGTVGNILNVIVLSRNKLKRSADVFVICMAVSDLFILWLFMPVWVKKVWSSLPTSNTEFIEFDQIYRGVYRWFTTTFYFISDWIAVVFSLERLLVVANPMQFLGRFTGKSAGVAVAAIVFVGTLKPTEFVVDYFSWVASEEPSNIWPQLRPTWLAEWNMVQEIVLATDRVLCFSMLLSINIILTVYLYRRKNIRDRDLQKHLPRKQERDSGATILGRGCAIQCLIFKFPSFMYNSLLLASRPPFCTYTFANADQEYWVAFVSFFLMVNTSINFYLYCAFSKNFRRQLNARFPHFVAKLQLYHTGCPSQKKQVANVDSSVKRSSASSTHIQGFTINIDEKSSEN